MAIYRKRVFHETRKNYQLDLFDPDNGTWEYSAVATNLGFDVRRLWRFMAGRGLHEKIIGELKSALALDTIPTNHYEARHGGFPGSPYLGAHLRCDLSAGLGDTGAEVRFIEEIEGFTLDDCEPICGDHIDATFTWNGGSDVSYLRGRAVRLRFDMYKANLYAIRF